MIPVFDGHNDVLLRLWLQKDGDPLGEFLAGSSRGHMDLPRMVQGGFAGGLFAIFVPELPFHPSTLEHPDVNPPEASSVAQSAALGVTLAMASLLHRMARQSQGAIRLCRSAGDIRQCRAAGAIAAIMHIEGAEAIEPELTSLEALYGAGLRSIGPVWSRPNPFGHGVPFRFPASPDTGPGLSDAGKALVRECNALGIAIDLSHLNEQGFWDVAKLSRAPLIASHSNAHAICPSSRNLTDDQIKAIGASGGMIGLNFANGFLRPDGLWKNDTGFDILLRHLDHLIEIAGVDHVGLGSDFDGARIPVAIGDVAGLPGLVNAMRGHGFDDATLRKLCFENWISVFAKTCG